MNNLDSLRKAELLDLQRQVEERVQLHADKVCREYPSTPKGMINAENAKFRHPIGKDTSSDSCYVCGREFPPEELNFLTGQPRCAKCISAPLSAHEEALRQAVAEQMMDNILAVAKGESAYTGGAAKINDLCVEVLEYFGGMRGLVRRWAGQLEIAMEKTPGRANVLQHFLGIAKLMEAADRQNHDRDVVAMSDEQLRREQVLMLSNMLQNSGSMRAKREGIYQELLEAVNVPRQEVQPVP